MDLGTKKESSESGALVPAAPDMPKISYPSFTLNDKVAEDFHKECPDCKLGEELTATVKLKVTSYRVDRYGKSVGFDVVSLDDISETPSGESEDDSEEKILGYKRKKPVAGSESEGAEISAKGLAD